MSKLSKILQSSGIVCPGSISLYRKITKKLTLFIN